LLRCQPAPVLLRGDGDLLQSGSAGPATLLAGPGAPVSTCLVVGGGFLGSHVARRLALDGERVIVYSRAFNHWLEADAQRSGERIELVEGLLPPGAGLRELVDAADVVYYMAGSSTPAMAQSDPGGSIASSVIPATALLDLMRTTGTRRVVIASSGGTVYGAARTLPTSEDHPTDPISLHGQNSLTIERYAAFFAERHGLEPLILRYSNPYGPGQLARRGQGVVAAWCEALAHEATITLYGDGHVRRDFVFVEDAALATTLVGARASGPVVFNVGSGRSHSLEELLALIQQVAGRQAVIHESAPRQVDVPATCLDCERIRAAVGWEPTTSIQTGLQASWRWALEAAR
jgi:UDP-glucose 4-epimerase